jgi:hypothetical protein
MKVKLRSGVTLDLQFGTDAEFFIQDSAGKVVPASKYIPGLKSKPFVLENGVCHPDGLSLEVGCPPSDTPQGMLVNLFKVIDEVKVKYLDPNGLTIHSRMYTDSSVVQDATKEDLEFGCGSEYDARSTRMFKQSDRDTSQKLRFSGFHIHLGYTEQEDNYFTYLDSSTLVKALDRLVQRYDLGTTPERSMQYGGLGAFRVKPYGIEYRCMDASVIVNPSKFHRLTQMLNDIPSVMEAL